MSTTIPRRFLGSIKVREELVKARIFTYFRNIRTFFIKLYHLLAFTAAITSRGGGGAFLANGIWKFLSLQTLSQ